MNPASDDTPAYLNNSVNLLPWHHENTWLQIPFAINVHILADQVGLVPLRHSHRVRPWFRIIQVEEPVLVAVSAIFRAISLVPDEFDLALGLRVALAIPDLPSRPTLRRHAEVEKQKPSTDDRPTSQSHMVFSTLSPHNARFFRESVGDLAADASMSTHTQAHPPFSSRQRVVKVNSLGFSWPVAIIAGKGLGSPSIAI